LIAIDKDMDLFASILPVLKASNILILLAMAMLNLKVPIYPTPRTFWSDDGDFELHLNYICARLYEKIWIKR